MTVLQAGKNLLIELSKIYNDREAATIADLVIEKISGLSKTQRLINKQLLLTENQQQQLNFFTEQLLQFKPVQYVLNEAWFAGLKLYVDEHVLIPRPETEELVDYIIQDAERNFYNRNPASPLTILDVGTGSGCIAIALKKKLSLSTIYALDISEQAIDIASKNASENNVKINFIQANILHLNAEINLPVFDIIVSNPPYIPKYQSSEMASNVVLFEPHEALFVPDNDPLIFYNAIADFAQQHLSKKGKLFFEINETMAKPVEALLHQKKFSDIIIKKDLQHKDRIISAVLR